MGQQLTKGMYGTEFSAQSKLFGLQCGQMSGDGERIRKNAGWYNKVGEKLGFGDFYENHAINTAQGIDQGELFILLPEQESYWNFYNVTKNILDPRVESPGVDYVAEHAIYVIAKEKFYRIREFSSHGREDICHIGQVIWNFIGRGEMKKLMTSF